MNTVIAPAKRSNYPVTVALVILVHLGLGYMIYQEVAKPGAITTELKKNNPEQAKPAVP